MKFDGNWIVAIITIVLAAILIFSIDTDSLCQKGCKSIGRSDGIRLDMIMNETCETKFDYLTSLPEKDCPEGWKTGGRAFHHCAEQKNYPGHYFSCCCYEKNFVREE